jgi:hypothetical protein
MQTIETVGKFAFRKPWRHAASGFNLAKIQYPQSIPWLLKVKVFIMGKPLQYLTDEHGERTAVVLPISEYEKLLQDLADLVIVAERRNERVVPHAQFVSELKRDGIL